MIRWRIAELAEKRGWTGYRLSKETGLTVPATYRLMRDEFTARIEADTLERMCRAFGVQSGKLLEWIDEG